ncbi:hypothetical protein ACI5KX_13975 [Erythrobacter sp. GH1-10]|uniref:hypothetical protein n=1 Tax=Erythrobacter sp. GH1-10 TaxID=3349334 RepID=UPI003877AFFF
MQSELCYETSKPKTVGYFVFSSAIFAIGLSNVLQMGELSFVGILGLIFFGAWPPLFLLLFLRPFRLRVDVDGFSLSGGTTRKSWQRGWREVGPFFVGKLFEIGRWPLPAIKMIQFDQPFEQRRLSRTGGLPMLWAFDGSVDEMVDELNAYRKKALSA